MSCESELQNLAWALRKKSPSCFRGWKLNVLQAFIRDEGKCVYCGAPTLPPGKGQGDHLLPEKKYPQWAENAENMVSACVRCNFDKGDDDPSHGKGAKLGLIDDKVRQGLILEARKQIDEARLKWEREFNQNCKAHFEEAVAQYRKCKESAKVIDEQAVSASL